MIDWEGSYNGVPFGPSANIFINTLDGWRSMPDMRSGDQPRPQRHGLYPGSDLLGGRTITISLVIGMANNSPLDAFNALAALDAVTTVNNAEAPLIFQTVGAGPEQVMCRTRRKTHTLNQYSGIGYDELTIEFVATDPRIYSTLLNTLTTGPSTIIGGLVWGAVSPYVWGTAGTGGGISAFNTGSIEAPYLLTFTGPASSPQLACPAQSKTLTIAHDLAAGETLVLDSDNRTVKLNGTASRYQWLGPASQWPQILPRANTFQFSDANPAARATLVYRSARA